jgi:arabinofuranosyltransferase
MTKESKCPETQEPFAVNAFAIIVGVFFLIYGLYAIGQSSFLAIDGQKYFDFADDGLITLRYGWNLAHGNGLVWNRGERVEGITSILWALQAALFSLFLDKRLVPAAMKLTSIGYLLLTAYCFLRIARVYLAQRNKFFSNSVLYSIAFLLPLSYFPLVYWSLFGMETSLQAALVASSVLLFLCAYQRPAVLGSTILALACMARPDCIVPALVIFGFRLGAVFRQQHKWKHLIAEISPFICILTALSVFRFFYYGSLHPNTYYLKVEGMTVLQRITLNGLGYIAPFLKEIKLLIVMVAVSLLIYPSREKLILCALPAAMVVYTIYVGGDHTVYWRFLSPYLPYALLALLLDFPHLDDLLCQSIDVEMLGHIRRYAALVLSGVLLCTVGTYTYFPNYISLGNPQQDNIQNINTAIWLNGVLKPSASVGVFYAGSIPFYTERYAIDFLGKCDPHIAKLPPDISGALSRDGQKSIPGHNKYDLRYSILEKQPTYVEGLRWGRQDVTDAALDLYKPVPIEFDTWSSYSKRRVLLRKDSPEVQWSRIHGDTSD